jgi:ribosomal-protein-alanine N-acetyltransferase
MTTSHSDRESGDKDVAIAIERLLDCPPDVHVLDEIARTAFSAGSFSVREEIKRGWSRIWVARCPPRDTRLGGTSSPPAGFLISWHVADELHILNIATALAMRRRGIATALMEEAIRYATTSRVRLMLLEVRRSNRAALGLYRRLGFSVVALRSGYYADTGEDAIEMNLVLDPRTGLALPGKDEFHVDG